MQIGILGTGVVAQTIGGKLLRLGHEVTLGGRGAANEKVSAWLAGPGAGASYATFAEAAAFGALCFNCTKGEGAEAAAAAAKDALRGKVLIDVTNPLDFSEGFPPSLFVSGKDSLGERVQRAAPEAKVVKALNTVNCNVMVEPERLSEPTDLFVCGDDADAKATAVSFLKEQLGWSSVVDLGALSAARGTEAYLLLWVRLMGALQTADFNLKLVR